MGEFLILMVAAIVTGVFAFVLIGLTAAKKIRIGGKVSSYILFGSLPLVMAGLLVAIGASAIFIISRWYLLLPIWMIVCNVLIFTVFLLIKINIFPGSSIEKGSVSDKKWVQMDAGRRLLNYSIYANLVYFLPLFAAVLYFYIKNPDSVMRFLFMANPTFIISAILAAFLMGAIPMLLVVPIYIIEIIVISLWLLLLGIAFSLSLNGTIRILCTSKRIRKLAVLYILLLLVPFVNLIIMLILCRLVKKELRSASDVGMVTT